jgi:hypothetical protein
MGKREGAGLARGEVKGEEGVRSCVARSREGVPAGSGADTMEAGGSRATRSCGSRGGGSADKWAGPEGGAQWPRERRKRGRVTGGSARFS